MGLGRQMMACQMPPFPLKPVFVFSRDHAMIG